VNHTEHELVPGMEVLTLYKCLKILLL